VIAGFNELQSLSSAILWIRKGERSATEFGWPRTCRTWDSARPCWGCATNGPHAPDRGVPAHYLQRHRRIQHTKDVAGSNGHSHKPGETS
jgi:hypothetical protein